jgi:hypothetical protein
LQFFTSDAPAGTRSFDAAAVASLTNIPEIDHVARSSTVMSFEFKPQPPRDNRPLQGASFVLKAATPGATTPCLFTFAGTPVGVDLLRMHHDFSSNRLAVHRFNVIPNTPDAAKLKQGDKWVEQWADAFDGNLEHAISLLKPIHQVMQHVVRHHSFAAKMPPASNWRMPTPPTIASSFALPPPCRVDAAVLKGAFMAFAGAVAPTFAGDCTITYDAVLAATDRRMVCRVQLGATERRLVLKFGSTVASIARERERVERVCKLFDSDEELKAHRSRVRLPLGWINDQWPVLVSDVWSGRSLNAGCPSNHTTLEKVSALLTEQIWPVIEALAEKGIFYVDLHAGNVMVDEALENAWLIDFEGAVAAAEVAGSPTQVAEEQLRAALDAQKADLLKRFEVI